MEKSEVFSKLESYKTTFDFDYFDIYSLDFIEDPSLLEKVFDVYRSNTTMFGFCIRDWKLTLAQWSQVFEFVKSKSQITIFVLAMDKLETEVLNLFSEFLKSNFDLKELDLNLSYLDTSGVKALTTGLASNYGLTSLSLNLIHITWVQCVLGSVLNGIANKKTLSNLHLQGTLDLEAVEALSYFIENNFNLIGLKITEGELNDQAMKMIKRALLTNWSLQRFDLEFEKKFGAEGMKEISEFIPQLPNLKVIALCELDYLYYLYYDKEAKEALLRSIHAKGNLEGLVLAAIGLTDEDLENLSLSISGNQQLKCLKLNGNNFTKDSLLRIIHEAKTCSGLETIGFKLDNEEDEGMDEILDSLREIKTLMDIQVYNNYDEVPCKEQIKQMIDYNKKLLN